MKNRGLTSSQKPSFTTVVYPFSLVLFTSITPIICRKKEKTKRKVSYNMNPNEEKPTNSLIPKKIQ